MRNQVEFDSTVDGWLSTRLRRPTNWASLLYSLPSVYPATVLESANRQSLSHMILFSDDTSTDCQLASFAMQLWSEGKLLTPHPQDASWCFTDSALDAALERWEGLTSIGDETLLLGTPTLFHFAKDRMAGRHISLLDKECPTTAHGMHRSVAVDLLREQPELTKASVIVADPPWYPSEMRAFLWTARRNSKQGTKILLSVPPVGTRPGIQQEWNKLLAWAADIGLHLLDYEDAILPYESPLFERNALAAVGIESFPVDWRRGDLAVFSCVSLRESLKSFHFSPSTPEWSEVMIGRVRLRIRSAPYCGWQDPALCQAVPGAVLPSVSRRDKRLESVTVWTSGNRVFHCREVSLLCRIAEALARAESPVSSIELHVASKLDPLQLAQVERATNALMEIIKAEEKEITDWKNGLNENVVQLPSCKG